MDNMIIPEANRKLIKLIQSFREVLYEDDDIFIKNLQHQKNLNEVEIKKYQHWEWPQGVGLYGLWKYYEFSKDEKCFSIIHNYYDRQLKIGFPLLNVNTATPYLAMTFLAEYTGEEKYLLPCIESAKQIMSYFPRTKERGFQHVTSDSINDQELWDDTLFMLVLFLAKIGRVLKNKEYIEEAQYQFLVHIKYLLDRKSGLYYHGWTFNGRNNFAEALWGRGNCWFTAAIPELISIVEPEPVIKLYLAETLTNQIEGLKRYQDKSGMWHTLIDDNTSYLEASATCGIGYGILKAINIDLIDKEYRSIAEKAIDPILKHISDDGILNQVSYGTPMGRISKNFYKNIEIKTMPYGQVLAIMFLLEYLKAVDNKH